MQRDGVLMTPSGPRPAPETTERDSAFSHALVESRKAAPPEALKTIPPFGLEANRKAIKLAIDWALEQRIIPRRLEVDELFDDTTRGLVP